MLMNSKANVTAKVTHQFAASPEVVFDAWVTGDKVRKWFAPGLGTMTRVAIDPRVGGSFSFVQRRGMDDVDHIGTYLEFDRPNRLVFTWQVRGTEHNSRVFIDFLPNENGSEVTLVHELDPHWLDYVEKTKNAWTKMMNAMADAIR